MSTEENKAILHRFFEEVFHQKNPAALEQFFAPDMVENNLPPEGIEAHQHFLSLYFNAFPDLTVTVEDMVAEGDKVATRGLFTGTHRGVFMGVPPTGKEVSVKYMDAWRVENGKAVENWVRLDLLDLMQQLGVVPAPPQPA